MRRSPTDRSLTMRSGRARHRNAARKRKKAPGPMSLAQARLIVLGSKTGRLGEPSKMPGFAFGISAFHCKRGSQLAKNPKSPCHYCYARTAFYKTKFEVKIAHKRRMKGLKHPLWVPAMVRLILHHYDPDDPYFRMHDSGDLMGVWHLQNIVEVCRLTPEVMYWLPTHEPHIVLAYLKRVAAGEAPDIPENLRIRISADWIGLPPDVIEGLEGLHSSTTHLEAGDTHAVQVSDNPEDTAECKAYTRGKRRTDAGTCADCRECWGKRKNISYLLHGVLKGPTMQLELLDLNQCAQGGSARPDRRLPSKAPEGLVLVRKGLKRQLHLPVIQ